MEINHNQENSNKLGKWDYAKIALPLTCLSIALFFLISDLMFIKKAVKLDATVIGYRKEALCAENCDFFMIFEFEYDNEQYQLERELMTAVLVDDGTGEFKNHQPYDIGETIEVYISPDNPKEFLLNTFDHRWAVTSFFMLFVVITTITFLSTFRKLFRLIFKRI